jgi:Holliday junction resolvasome RuvABC ATP-dependent DNA helicase subunit
MRVAKEIKMKKGKLLKIKLNEEMAKKLAYVSEKEGLTLQNQLVAMIRQKISYFERVKGNIPKNALNEINLDEFANEE